ncbi:heavy-metal-associated domain-containing protein [Pararhodobacter sp. CCB-MM2]|uniref:heavy-metal-associated domain-containing protein n=1 Tax=Pararhodobacter sp. CCB-MM2 TaxID=1786003 RepID=UPI0008300B7A|nr:heavy-metal-associated domain-containing protein [Pararhodobacter sp. CCB-MM2]MCA2010317.1 heavy-metal-associated domain-containing protein [Cereibacter sphaeroides]
MSQSYTLSVPDMSCGHCRASIDQALQPLGAQAAFDMAQRRVTVTGEAAQPQVIAALDAIGFPAEPV